MQEELLSGHNDKDCAGHPKHASSNTVVRQHYQQHHDELQTHLLEADRQQGVAAPAVPAKVCIEYTTFMLTQCSVNVY